MAQDPIENKSDMNGKDIDIEEEMSVPLTTPKPEDSGESHTPETSGEAQHVVTDESVITIETAPTVVTDNKTETTPDDDEGEGSMPESLDINELSMDESSACKKETSPTSFFNEDSTNTMLSNLPPSASDSSLNYIEEHDDPTPDEATVIPPSQSTLERVSADCYRIDFSVASMGKHISTTKRRIRWQFGSRSTSKIHTIQLYWSLTSGKRILLYNDATVHISKKRSSKFSHKFTSHLGEDKYPRWEDENEHELKVIAYAGVASRQYDLFIDGVSFFQLDKKDSITGSTKNEDELMSKLGLDGVNSSSLHPTIDEENEFDDEGEEVEHSEGMEIVRENGEAKCTCEEEDDDESVLRLKMAELSLRSPRSSANFDDKLGGAIALEADRYHVYASYGCPQSQRVLMTMGLRGLETDLVSFSLLRYATDKDGTDEGCWVFDEVFPDHLHGVKSLKELYQLAGTSDNDSQQKMPSRELTLPLLWDKITNTIITSDVDEICHVLQNAVTETAFSRERPLDKDGSPRNLLPPSMKADVDLFTTFIKSFETSIEKCASASTQEEYIASAREATNGFDKVEAILENSRYAVGETLTVADISLFCILLRWDEVYCCLFRLNSRMVCRSDILLNYSREVYQMGGVTETCSMEQIKEYYYLSYPELNKSSIIPIGMGFMDLLKETHNRG